MGFEVVPSGIPDEVRCRGRTEECDSVVAAAPSLRPSAERITLIAQDAAR